MQDKLSCQWAYLMPKGVPALLMHPSFPHRFCFATNPDVFSFTGSVIYMETRIPFIHKQKEIDKNCNKNKNTKQIYRVHKSYLFMDTPILPPVLAGKNFLYFLLSPYSKPKNKKQNSIQSKPK